MDCNKIEFESGSVQFMVEARRSGGGDFGVTFRVFGNGSEEKVELLRFDCFKNNPHYHYDPTGKGETHNLDRTKYPNPLVWVMDQLQTKLPALIEHAGYSDIAHSVDPSVVATELSKRLPDIVQLHDRALQELAPAE
jgi:hypothetical protein